MTVISTLDNNVNDPVGVEFVATKGKTGEEMEKKFLSQATLVYWGCMQDIEHGGTSTVIEHVLKSNECDSVHHVCSEKVFPEFQHISTDKIL